jgi:hypothetical protein
VNIALKYRIRILSVRDFPPEKVDNLFYLPFSFRDMSYIPKTFFHKMFFPQNFICILYNHMI